MKKIVPVILILFALTATLSWTIFARIGKFSRLIIGLMVGGYEQYTELHLRTTLSSFARLPAVQKLDPNACELFRDVMTDNHGFFAVLALGDKNGNAICTADPNFKGKLPTMADRTYYKKVRTSSSLVAGEYAISRTTDRPALHYAYPVLDKDGTFNGFILAAVDLKWFVSGVVDDYFKTSDVQVLAVDQAGKLLFAYPSNNAEVGKPMFDARQASTMLAGRSPYFIKRDPEGILRVYTYEPLPTGMADQILVLVGFALKSFTGMFTLIGLLTIGSLFYIYDGMVNHLRKS